MPIAQNFPNEAKLVSKWHFLLRCSLLFIFGILLIFAFPPFNYSTIGWIGIIPLYLLVLNLKSSRAFIAGFVWGYGWSLASIFWLKGIEPFIPFALSIILAFFYAFWALMVPLAKRYLLVPPEIQVEGYNDAQAYLIKNTFVVKEIFIVLLLACWWCVIEWIRTWIFSGFPWNLYAISQWQKTGLIQVASIAGIYGVSFILIFLNISIAHLLINIYKKIRFSNIKSGFRIIPISLYIGIILVLGSFYFGIKKLKLNLNNNSEMITLKAAVVQGDIPQCRFYNESEAASALKIYIELSEKLLPLKPDILIWPESAVPQPLRGDGYLSVRYRNEVFDLIDKYHVPFFLGTIDYGIDQKTPEGEIPIYNSALLLNKSWAIAERYNKMHLVPWGEYTPGEYFFPFKYIYPWIKRTFGMGRSLTQGTENTIFVFKKDIRAAALICYEDIFPEIARKHVLGGANLLVTITNDAWFPTEDELQQHMGMAVFRSVENNRTMIRVGNCGGTCVIRPNGVISDSLFFKKIKDGAFVPDPGKKGKAAGILNVAVKKYPITTFYTKCGNIFIYICIIITICISLWMLWNWKDKKTLLLKEIDND